MNIDIVQAVTGIVAVYGAGLATYNAIQARRKDRHSLKLKLTTAMYTYGSNLGPPMVSIETINDGYRAVVANVPQLKIAEDPDHIIALIGADGSADFPKRLDQGDSGTVRIGYRDLAMTLARKGHMGSVSLQAICTDSIGNRYESVPWTVNIREWLEMAA